LIGMSRFWIVAAVIVLALALLRPWSHQAALTSSTSPPWSPAPDGSPHRHHARGGSATDGAYAGPPVVYVAGAVAHPGLYTLGSRDRVADAVREAGGLSPAADAAGVNLAAHIVDGEEIDVPLPGERAVSSRARAAHARTRRKPSPPPEGVDVNAADAATLARVPGIGRTVAARIVAVRERDGAFASLDELLDVAGMTSARLDRARPYLLDP
jgi:competence protein ComEA